MIGAWWQGLGFARKLNLPEAAITAGLPTRYRAGVGLLLESGP